MPVSIKMAKTQNLSLNPAKISGTCGRLMCCLKYEQNAYEDAAKRMPKVESFVQTPDGPGNVKSVDLLRERVKVCLDGSTPSEPLKTYRGCEIQVLRNGKGSREGIEIPAERPERYVEEKPEEEFITPVITTPFYMNPEPAEMPFREKIGGPGAEGKSRRRRGRGKTGRPAGEQAAPEAKPRQPKAPEEKKNPQGGGNRPRRERRPEQSGSPKPPRPETRPENAGEGAAKPHRRHHRGGHRRGKGGGDAAPKSES